MRILTAFLILSSMAGLSQELVLTCPSDLEIECSQNTGEYGEASAEGDCSGITISFTDNIIEGICPANFTIERTWTAANECDEMVECLQVIVIQDNQAPYFSNWEFNLWLNCESRFEFYELSDSLTTDHLSLLGLNVSNLECSEVIGGDYQSDDVSGNCFGQSIISFDLFDECGNEAYVVCQVHFYDSIPPQVFCPDDTIISISNLDYYSQPEVTDNCTSEEYINWEFEDILYDTIAPFQINRIHKGFDCINEDLDPDYNSGLNFSSCHQQILVLDSFGCTNEDACNFNPLATENDESCLFIGDDCSGWNDNIANGTYDENCECIGILEGCTDQSACNYNPEAEIDNGTCATVTESCFVLNPVDSLEYFYDANCDCEPFYWLEGMVYFDENENGEQDSLEYGVGNINLTVNNLGYTLTTNDQGEFQMYLPLGTVVSVQNESPFEFNTTNANRTFTSYYVENHIPMSFGISDEEVLYNVCIDFYPNGNSFLCNAYSNHNICFRNMGNVPIDGVVEVEYDNLFQGYQEVTPIDSVNGNIIYMSFEDLLPGEMYVYDVSLLTPTVDFIGEFVSSISRIYGYSDGVQLTFGEQELTMEITCAYDPNDKQAFPLGYTDEHWLLNETEQEFLVRFQNTGNAPAQDIRIQDTIDVNYDLSTFELRANSHSVMTTINEQTRVVDFFFENIQLPDSVNNEPESHGLVAYSISPVVDLPVGTVLENTAYIYFDNNEPIITNTTWNTIHECGGEAAFELSSESICVGEEVSFESSYEVVEEFDWRLDGSSLSSESLAINQFNDAGAFEITLEASNQLCADSVSQTITVYDFPIAEITENGAILIASESESYQWLLNGIQIEGSTEQTHLPIADGAYSVIITNEGNCSSTSEEVMIVNIQELEGNTFLLYPNPMTDVSYLEFKDAATRTVRILDSQGKEVRVWTDIATQSLEIHKGELAVGSYVVSVTENGKEFSVKLLLE